MALAARLRREARRADQRRVLVCAGEPGWTRERARRALAAADLTDPLYLGEADPGFPADTLAPARATELLGTTREAVVVDCHTACRPNALGRAVGAVDGGGLLLLLTPPLELWPDRRDGFDATLAAPPFERADVTGHFRTRLVETLRAHRGVAIVDAEGIVDEGLTDPPPRRGSPSPSTPADHTFPAAAYEACRTADQAEAVHALEALRTDGTVVVEADRGRGKSSAAGLAAGALVTAGQDVLVTAPAYRNAHEVFARAEELLATLGTLEGTDGDTPTHLDATGDGRVRFAAPGAAVDRPGDPDAVIVDEAAALPVDRLTALLAAPAVAYATTVHGYEGTGRGFDVRFRDRLADHEPREVSLGTPIRYAPADPVEVWAFRALALDARPPVAPLVADAVPERVTYRRLSPAALLADEDRLREAFGLLVSAHYRTEPADLARLLDGPNVSVRGLLIDGHVVSVAMLAREGNLPADLRARMYAGERVRGNMVPDVLTTQCRDEAAAEPVGWRLLRVATHEAARSRGLGSHLLTRVREEAARGDLDYLSVSYGATPPLVRFWAENGFRTVHLSTSRNDRSGEHSAVMLDPLTGAGDALADRHADWFLRRVPGTLADPLADADPDVVRACLRAVARAPDPDLSTREWRVVAGAAAGAAIYETAPRPFRRLALRHLVAPAGPVSDRLERLLVAKPLQGRSWTNAADAAGYRSASAARRAIGEAAGRLVDLYGTETARAERDRL